MAWYTAPLCHQLKLLFRVHATTVNAISDELFAPFHAEPSVSTVLLNRCKQPRVLNSYTKSVWANFLFFSFQLVPDTKYDNEIKWLLAIRNETWRGIKRWRLNELLQLL